MVLTCIKSSFYCMETFSYKKKFIFNAKTSFEARLASVEQASRLSKTEVAEKHAIPKSVFT